MIFVDELESRVAAALHSKADETATDPAAWATHRQRMLATNLRPTQRSLRRVVPLVAAAAAVAVIAVTATVGHRSPQPQTAQIVESVPLPACPATPTSAGTASRARLQPPISGASGSPTTGLDRAATSTAVSSAAAAPTARPPYSPAVDPPASRSATSSTSADGSTPNWYSAAKGRQLAAVFRGALPQGVSIDNNTPNTAAGHDLQFRGGGQVVPGSTLVVKVAQADAELTSAHGQSSLQVSVMRSPTAVRDCFDTGDGRSGTRTIQAGGTIIDRGQGVFTSNADMVASTAGGQAGLAAFTVLVYRPDGSRIQVDQLQNTGDPVLTLDQLAAAAAAPGFDLSTPA